jgi:lysophospholipase L1-like esterase
MRAIGLALCVALAGCGGGGSGPAPSPVSQSAPIQSAPDAPKCVPLAVVKIQLFGDSTMVGIDGATRNVAPSAPGAALQAAMDRQFGMGSVTVEVRAVSGTSSVELMAGTDGENQSWPGSVVADIIVVNHGINDAVHSTPIDAYKKNLTAFAKAGPVTLLETPIPNFGVPWDVQPYASAMRDVAASTGAKVIDTNAYFLGLANWQSYLPDGVHPVNEGYGLITANALIPAVAPAVAKLKCQ